MKSFARGMIMPIYSKIKYAIIHQNNPPMINNDHNNILVIMIVFGRVSHTILMIAIEVLILIVIVIVAVAITINDSNRVIISRVLVY
jgi:hypothetical protein